MYFSGHFKVNFQDISVTQYMAISVHVLYTGTRCVRKKTNYIIQQGLRAFD
jgi:hypothetical protein